MKNIFTFIFLIFSTANMHSQSVKTIIYVNEHNEEIDFISFSNKLESGLFTQSLTINNLTVFKQLILKEIFGKLDSKKKSQLNKLFLNRYKIDSNTIWYIHYAIVKLERDDRYKIEYAFMDSLVVVSKREKEKYFTRKINRNIVTNNPDTIKIFANRIKKFELRKIKNPINTTLLHVNNIKYHPSVLRDRKFKFYEYDHNSIINTTFKVEKDINDLIIVHPDGSYYTSTNKSNFNKKDLFKFKSFKREEKKWRRKYEKIN